ncbi:MAG: hypothetical protein ACRDNW_15530 [Trebonia sp.]
MFDKVIVITDRQVLDRQLQRTIYQFDHTPGVVQKIDEAHSSQGGDAAVLLKQAVGEKAIEPRQPEETYTEYLTRALRDKQPNLSYFAFTATPTAATLNLFGRHDPRRPFHVYSMRQAIEEGYILDVLANYITYDLKWKLRNLAVEQQESASANPEVDERKAKQALVKFAARHPTSVKQRARLIVDDFRDNVARRLGGRAKAMVVTSGRAEALEMY